MSRAAAPVSDPLPSHALWTCQLGQPVLCGACRSPSNGMPALVDPACLHTCMHGLQSTLSYAELRALQMAPALHATCPPPMG